LRLGVGRNFDRDAAGAWNACAGSTVTEVIYTAAANYVGPDSFVYVATDGVLSSAAGDDHLTVGSCISNTPPVAKIVASPLADFSPEVVNKLVISPNGSNACLCPGWLAIA
jgi:hypothetical protein